ncbi:lytic transglycosylase domain-containing protein [Agrobacterium tumefaciens]|uniref:lytic transglycosylase domain-containing protein n=1 Tax=Agrobacterium tumefaciens TaxID=358 RepID=UPI001AECFF86|nr:lytic transglycosylase domain-containing protein [Agrobacterium tumefaciens]
MKAATALAVYFLCSIPPIASAAVLEELDAGALAPMDSSQQDDALVHGGQAFGEMGATYQASLSGSDSKDLALVPAGTAVIFDAGPDHVDPVRMKATKALPEARSFASPLTPRQARMRRLAVAVAHRFASAPGVRRARLEREDFVLLFTTMIHRESNFNSRAVSQAGAKGLGQLMPETARSLGVCDVFSPRDNLNGAATYLTMMLDQFGSASMALAAYNAGPTAVTQYRGIPPYSETRQYVADIIHAASASGLTAPSGASNVLAYQVDDGMRTSEPFDTLLDADVGSSRCNKRSRTATVIDGTASISSQPII